MPIPRVGKAESDTDEARPMVMVVMVSMMAARLSAALSLAELAATAALNLAVRCARKRGVAGKNCKRDKQCCGHRMHSLTRALFWLLSYPQVRFGGLPALREELLRILVAD